MPKTAKFTTITPLPAGIMRKSVRDMYHDHLAMIDLNPLVVERFCCRPPSYAPTEEYYSTWYTIKDKVSYLPGGFARGSVSYHACFHDLPDGLETHVYAPLGLEIHGKWSIGGSLPGEPKRPVEKGLNTPRHGLYIREDVKMTCSTLLLGFVKRTFKDSHASLVAKLVERAHLLESNFANERLNALRNVDPRERMAVGNIIIAPPPEYISPTIASRMRQDRPLPSPPSPHRPQTSPQPAPRALATHMRNHSDPITSPGFSQASTLIGEGSRQNTPVKYSERPAIPRFANLDNSISASAPQPTAYLLPATTYDGSLSQPKGQRFSLYPGGQYYEHAGRVTFLFPPTPSHQRKQSDVSVFPPRVSYSPSERPISFNFPVPQSAFDTNSNFASVSDQHNLLDEIDDAIDQVFLYRAASHTPTTEVLPATKYQPEVFLPSTRYNPRHQRKDSVVPSQVVEEEKAPPVPLKDDKYRKR